MPQTAVPDPPGEAGRSHRVFNFRRPEHLSKDQVKALEHRLEAFSRALSTVLGQFVRDAVDVRLLSVSNATYPVIFDDPDGSPAIVGEGSGDESFPFVHAFYRFARAEPPGVISLSLELLYGVIERLMGGVDFTPISPKPLTDFEKLLARKVFDRMLGRLAESLHDVLDMEPQIEAMQCDPRLLPRTFGPEEPFLRHQHRIELGTCQGLLSLSLPFRVLRPHFGRLKAVPRTKETVLDLSAIDRVHAFAGLPLSVRAELGPVEVTLETLLALEVGDVIPLDLAQGRNVTVRVEEKRRFGGRPGLLGDRVVIEITRVVEEEEANAVDFRYLQ